jgi:hypothetical protein
MKTLIYKEKYLIYEDGRVYSFKSNKFLKPKISGTGYYYVSINNKNELLHRVLSICFIPNPNNKLCVNHINCVKTDNAIVNLEWCTQKENIQHSWINGKSKISKKNIEITKERSSKLILNTQTGIYYQSVKDAAESANIKKGTLSAMLCGQNRNKSYFIYA